MLRGGQSDYLAGATIIQISLPCVSIERKIALKSGNAGLENSGTSMRLVVCEGGSA